MSVYKSLQNVTVALQNSVIKKSGKNKFAGFKYFELGDFLPTVNKLFSDNGLNGYVTFTHELACLVITDVEDDTSVEITSPMVDIDMKGANPIQNLGAVQTYQRRYLYLAALGIVENDVVDTQEMKSEPKPPQLALKSQVKIIMDKVGDDLDRGQSILKWAKVDSYEKMTQVQASATIKQLNK